MTLAQEVLKSMHTTYTPEVHGKILWENCVQILTILLQNILSFLFHELSMDTFFLLECCISPNGAINSPFCWWVSLPPVWAGSPVCQSHFCHSAGFPDLRLSDTMAEDPRWEPHPAQHWAVSHSSTSSPGGHYSFPKPHGAPIVRECNFEFIKTVETHSWSWINTSICAFRGQTTHSQFSIALVHATFGHIYYQHLNSANIK